LTTENNGATIYTTNKISKTKQNKEKKGLNGRGKL
jgi:hypothetical protein